MDLSPNMNTILVEANNAVLFLVDPKNDVFDDPEIDSSKAISANAHCIAIGVQHAVDGPVTIGFFTNSEVPTDTTEVYRGQLITKSREVGFISPEFEELISQIVPSEVTDISVRMDEPDYASLTCVVIN